MAQLFEHTFQQVLFGVGAVLLLAGGIFALSNWGTAPEAGLMEAVSNGFAAFFLALFAGSLAGVGFAMMADALILGLRGNKAHVAVSVSFSLLSLLAAASSMARAEQASFPLFVIFFAGLSASGAFMLSSAVFGFSALFHSFITQAQERESKAVRGQEDGAPSRTRRASGRGG